MSRVRDKCKAVDDFPPTYMGDVQKGSYVVARWGLDQIEILSYFHQIFTFALNYNFNHVCM